MLAILAMACGGGGGESDPTASNEQSLRATIGAEGGELVGKPGTAFDGVRLAIPAGALAQATEIEITQAKNLNPLPAAAVGCGPEFEIQPAGLVLDGRERARKGRRKAKSPAACCEALA